MALLLLMGEFLFWEVGSSGLQSLEVTETESANASTGSPREMVSGATPSYTPLSLTHVFCQVGTLNHNFYCIGVYCESWRNLY